MIIQPGDDEFEAPKVVEPEPPMTRDGGAATTVSPAGSQLALRALRRELTEAELDEPGTRKMLLALYDRGEETIQNLQSTVVDFHRVDKRAAVLEAQLAPKRRAELLQNICLGAGGAIIGASPCLWDKAPGYAIVIGILGLALILVPIIINKSTTS